MENTTKNDTVHVFQDQKVKETGRQCFFQGFSETLQLNYFYYSNFALTPVTILLAAWCFLSNGFVLLMFIRGKLQLRAGFYSLCSLTTTDVLWSGLVIPLYVSFRIKELLTGRACANKSDWDNPIMVTSFFLCVFSTVGTLGVMSVDRYLAVSKPMWYKVVIKNRHIITACCGVWLITLAMVILKQIALFPRKVVELFEACYMVICSSLIIVLQLLTLMGLRKHNNGVANLAEGSAQRNNRGNALERKLAILTRHVVGLLGIILIPVCILVVVSNILRTNLSPFAEPLYFTLATLCSGINPVLYYRGNSQIRQGITSLVKCH